MKVNIFHPLQTNNSYYTVQKNMNWNLENDNSINDINNFHYFKFFDITEDAKIFPIWYSAMSKEMDRTNDLEIIKLVEQNYQKFIKKELIPVLIDPLEGNTTIAESIDSISEYFGNAIKFYFINADYKLQTRKNKFTHVFVDQWIHHIPPQKKPIKYYEDRTYINCNRVARYHRCMLMDKLIENNLVKNGFNTWANTYGAFDEYKRDFPNTKIEKQKFDILDVKDISKTNPTHMIPMRHCMGSFIYVNTETHYTSENLFISEKTYKPISIGMPFISLGNPGTLKYLHSIGFETFSDWIDERYDLDLPLSKRVEIVVDNIKNLSKITNKQSLRKEMQETINHNLALYKRLQRRNSFIAALKRIEKGEL